MIWGQCVGFGITILCLNLGFLDMLRNRTGPEKKIDGLTILFLQTGLVFGCVWILLIWTFCRMLDMW